MKRKLANPAVVGVIARYAVMLPVSLETPIITLGEGGTPLLMAPTLAASLGPGFRVWLKVEGNNPTGSFKDRGMALAVSKAVEAGKKVLICASTGNTSASAAAYAAAAGLRCVVLVPHGKIALGKMAQALAYGAIVLEIRGSFDDALCLVRACGSRPQYEIVNSINPFRIEGQKTAAFEICEQLGAPPAYHCLPVGNAANIVSYWRGYSEYWHCGQVQSRPRMLGFQAQGAAPLVRGHVVRNPETVATAIRIGNPASGPAAREVVTESNGQIEAVSDPEILAAYDRLASECGVFCEPASAAAVAGLLKLADQNFFQIDSEPVDIVCTLTGHGLKDPDCALRQARPALTIEPTLAALEQQLEAL